MNATEHSYPLPKETLPTLSLAYHLDDLFQVREFFHLHGVQTKNTRIDRYVQYLQNECNGDSCDPSRIFKNSPTDFFYQPIDWFLYVLREIHELVWIHKGMKSRPPNGLEEKLRAIVAGRDFAALDADSRSRDTQFELRIASYFCQMGCDVDVSQRTDITVSFDEFDLYIECKRIGSATQLEKRLSLARKQLREKLTQRTARRMAMGCIAADVTKVAFTQNGITIGVTGDHSRDMIFQKLKKIRTDIDKPSLFRDCQWLLVYWLQIHIPALVLNPQTPITRFSSIHIEKPGVACKEKRALKRFHEIFEGATNTKDERVTPSQRLRIRTRLEVPAGTTFRICDDVITKYLADGATGNQAESEVVGELTLNGVKYEFLLFELKSLPAKYLKVWRVRYSYDTPEAHLHLLLELYMRRFPYEGMPPPY